MTYGLLLMVIGMSVVFIVLALVISFGRIIIALSNKVPTNEEKTTANESKKEQIIKEAVRQLTNNRGQVVSIRKL